MIEFPISENETIILKSMSDYSKNKFYIDECSIFDDTLEKAKPMQYPYNTFGEITEFELRSHITTLLAHLYYDYYKPGEESFEAIVNECCDLIDDSFTPDCENHDNIQFSVSKCIEKDFIRNITYKNCKYTGNKIPSSVDCNYIPFKNIYGYIILILVFFVISIKLFIFAVILWNKSNTYVLVSGFKFLSTLIFSSMILDISLIFWV
eukprot:jgi/Orpsp1_1/1182994/evm.model.c7180000083419.1